MSFYGEPDESENQHSINTRTTVNKSKLTTFTLLNHYNHSFISMLARKSFPLFQLMIANSGRTLVSTIDHDSCLGRLLFVDLVFHKRAAVRRNEENRGLVLDRTKRQPGVQGVPVWMDQTLQFKRNR